MNFLVCSFFFCLLLFRSLAHFPFAKVRKNNFDRFFLLDFTAFSLYFTRNSIDIWWLFIPLTWVFQFFRKRMGNRTNNLIALVSTTQLAMMAFEFFTRFFLLHARYIVFVFVCVCVLRVLYLCLVCIPLPICHSVLMLLLLLFSSSQ